MRHRKPLHPVVSDHRREIDIRTLSAALRRPPMQFPFLRIKVPARDHIRLYPLTVRAKRAENPHNARTGNAQIIAVTWRRMTFGLKPFFVCPRCHARRVFLYSDTLQAYCRTCADLWYWCQRKHDRTRLLHWSHKLRVRLDDQTGKPGNPFPARPKRQRKTTYRRIIAKLRNAEQQYMHIIAHDRRCLDRARDEYGRYLPRETSERIASPDSAIDRSRSRGASPEFWRKFQLEARW